MSGRIVITLDDDGDQDIAVEVAVSGDLSTVQAVGLMEIAKLQHLESKKTPGPTVHIEQTPDGMV